MFKAGDHVVCIDASGPVNGLIEYGYDYIIQDVVKDEDYKTGEPCHGATLVGHPVPSGLPFGRFNARRFRLRGVAASESQRVAFIKMKA